ncbi:type IV pilus secretin PilQ [Pseudomonadota bacterium]
MNSKIRADLGINGHTQYVMCGIRFVQMVVSVGLVLFSGLLHAAQLNGLKWEGDSTTLTVQLDGATTHSTDSLDNGKRLRISLPNTTLGKDAVDISGRGLVKGVFPYLADNGTSVYVDFLLRESGELVVTPADFGFRVSATPVGGNNNKVASAQKAKSNETMAKAEVKPEVKPKKTTANEVAKSPAKKVPQKAAASVAASKEKAPISPAGNILQDVTFSPLPGGRVQIDLKMSSKPEQPGSFSTKRPPRIAFDFFNTKSQLKKDVLRIATGAVTSLAAITTDDRTRIVLNLVRPVSYETQYHENGMTLVVSNVPPTVQSASTVKPKAFSRINKRAGKHSISKIDFRRSREGGGQVIVNLSDPAIGVDIREEAGEIIVDFSDTLLPKELERRLDVLDFATPVQTIDAFNQNGNTRMVITPLGQYQQLAYQTGNVFTVQVVPVVEDEEEKKVDEFGYSGEKLSLNFQRISVRAALQVIADFTGLNFVTSDSVKGSLTLRLQEVPWDQALDIILQTKGLAMRQKGNVVWVAPAAEIAAKERQALEATKQVAELEPLSSELIQINYAKAAEIANLLKSIKSVDTGIQPSLFGGVNVGEVKTESNTLLSPRGNVTVDNRTNTLLIQDTPSKIKEVRKLIAQLDKPVRQVLIETRIVEAADDFGRSLGARLGFQRVTENLLFPGTNNSVGTGISSGSLAGTGAIRDTLVNGAAPDDDNIGVGTSGLNVDLPSPGVDGDNPGQFAFEIFKAGTGFAHLLSLEISALEASGRGKVLANPRVVTSNQQSARIEQGQERIFTTSVLGVGSVVTKKAVLSLTVVPQITPDDRVILDVVITKDSFVSPDSDTLDTKEVTTQVLLDNGETIVIGGIYEQTKLFSVSKVPILGDLPLIGVFFRKKEELDRRRELLIFLTPRILDSTLNAGT